MIDPATVERIKASADIVEVVSDYVHLTRRGANYMGLCPFHNERTPSFSVNRSRNFCYCFSCKKGGSPINFIMQKEGLSYHDALLQLARKYNIEVNERELTDEEKERQSEREAMLVVNEWAMLKMEHDLNDTEEGRNVGLSYFYGRKVTPEAIKAFHLGYAIDNGSELLNAARRAGYNIEVLHKSGLIGRSQQGHDYDRFRGRVIFPIINTAGKVIAFGGRDLKGGPSKYINSPESDIYKKSNELYGIYQARSAMVKADKCYLVEGYLDVIGFWQSGIQNVVASSGTALTDGQIALIHRFTNKITLIYDGDDAGIKASLRGVDMLLSHRMEVKVLVLPDGHDPDSFAKEHDPEYVKRFIAENETDVIRFKAKVLMNESADDPQKKVAAVNSIVASIAHIPEPVARDVYIKECSNLMKVSETAIRKAVRDASFRIAEQWKKSRAHKDIDSLPSSGSIQPHVSQDMTAEDSGDGSTDEQNLIKHSTLPTGQSEALKRLEQMALKRCLQYGYMTYWTNNEEDAENPEELSVIDFINDELSADNITFSYEPFRKTFDMMLQMEADFVKDRNLYSEQLMREIDRKRKEGYVRIAQKDLGISGITAEEKRLEESLSVYYARKLNEYTKTYPILILASHEDDDIRETVTEILKEPHQLSKVHTHEGAYMPTDADLIQDLVPRAVNEWKECLLNIRYMNVLDEIRHYTELNDLEKLHEAQTRFLRLTRIRSEMAKCLGDRVVAPHRK